MRNPLTSACGHSLCENCWLNRVEMEESEEYIVCMHCRVRTTLSETKLITNEELHETIMNSITMCGNQECKRQMPLRNRELHMEVCKHNDKSVQLCCFVPSRRTNRIMKRGRHILRAVSRKMVYRLCKAALDSALETYTQKANALLAPLAENVEALEQLMNTMPE